jgi:hypothetical protein
MKIPSWNKSCTESEMLASLLQLNIHYDTILYTGFLLQPSPFKTQSNCHRRI